MCISGSGAACKNAPRCKSPGPPRQWYRDDEFYGKEPSLALVLLRDISNQQHFLENAVSGHLGHVGRA